MITDETIAYAIGYYYGRAIGNDELRDSVVNKFPNDVRELAKSSFNWGYERGVADYCAELERQEQE